MLHSRIKLRDQMVSVLAYPAFVLLSTVAALAVILLFVVPTLAPLVSESVFEAADALLVPLIPATLGKINGLKVQVTGMTATDHIYASVWDGGGNHKGPAIRELLRRNKRLTPERLPAYAPDLNPVEVVWSWLKFGELAKHVPDGWATWTTRS